MSGSFSGYATLLRLGVRRDRLRLAAWVLGLASFPVASYTSYESLFPTAASRQVLVTSFGSTPAFRLLLGPARDLASSGGFTAWRSGVFSGVFVALMAVFTVVRHSRAEEEAGRTELVASGVVGRRAQLAAAVTLAVGTAAVAGVGVASLLVGAGAPAGGSVLMGATLLGTGAVFAGLAAVAAQIGSFAHTANGLGGAVLGVAYLLRGWGDSSDAVSWVSWCSPLGWGQEAHPFTGDRWGTLVVPFGATVVLLAVADRLLHRRDVGAGLWADRRGPAVAGSALSGPFGLAWRLQRVALVGWSVGYAVCGVLFGSIATSAAKLLADNPSAAKVLSAGSGSPTEAFVASMISILAITASMYAVSAVLRARREEVDDRVEPLLATATTRGRWLASHLVFGLGGSALITVLGGAAVAIGARGAADAPSFAAGLGAALAQVPAVWVIVGVAAALVGVVPRASAGAWTAVVAALVLTFFGPLLDLPTTVLDLSPFSHVPKAPAVPLTAAPLAVLAVVAVAFGVVGFVGIARRDIG